MQQYLEKLDIKYNTSSTILNDKIMVNVLKYSNTLQKNIIIDSYYITKNKKSCLFQFDLFHKDKASKNMHYHYQGYFKTLEQAYIYMFEHQKKHLNNFRKTYSLK